jgi:hypothetical protein
VRSEVQDANYGACDSFAHKRRLVWVVNLPFGLVLDYAAVIGFKVRVNITSSLFLHIVTDLLTHSHMRYDYSDPDKHLKSLRGDIHRFIRRHRW